ncbi:MAG: NADPH:quinone reductase [Segniliparus sp.]|uniref:NADPH:quinone reductase n=1 Tax=Segniliparus sp. TaxID=2804064 RepID=UPI003F3B85D5
MRAAYVEKLGPAESIRVGELPAPRPGQGEALVRVAAVSVNPVDAFVRSGLYATDVPFPFVIGRDLVGTVHELGEGTAGVSVGDRVWSSSLGHAGRQGAAAEFAVAAADRLYRLPDGIDPVVAVAAVHPGSTAYLAVHEHGRVRAGQTVLVVGAGGNVGMSAVTMAAEIGARVVAVASVEDERRCLDAGAAQVVDRRGDWKRVVADRHADSVDVYIDAFGENDLELAVGLLAAGGRIVALAGARAAPTLPLGKLYMRDGAVIGFVISRASTDQLARAATRTGELLAAGALVPKRIETLPLSEAARAHALVEAGGMGGTRLVLLP